MTSTKADAASESNASANLPLTKRPVDIFFICIFAVIYATMIVSLTAIPTFGAEFFGPIPTPNPGIFLAYNAPYVVIPFILLLRMRKPLPFQRKF